ncbi:hypothetical protein GCM10023238_29990 [Streptomyces heliomycini]
MRPGARPGGLWLALDANPALYEEDELALHRDGLTVLRRLGRSGAVRRRWATWTSCCRASTRATPPATRIRSSDPHGGVRGAGGGRTRADRRHLRRRTPQYAALNAEANRLARLLTEHGARPGRVVALPWSAACGCCPPCWPSSRPAPPTCPGPRPPAERLRLVVETRPPSAFVTEQAHAHLAGTPSPPCCWTTRTSRRTSPAAPAPTSPTPTGTGR